VLRSKKFRRFELIIISVIGLLLVTAAVVGAVLGVVRGDWRVLLASAGIGALAAVYLIASRRGRPL
jgi:uncharacterized membrane protein YoaK (UPF0700 family)